MHQTATIDAATYHATRVGDRTSHSSRVQRPLRGRERSSLRNTDGEEQTPAAQRGLRYTRSPRNSNNETRVPLYGKIWKIGRVFPRIEKIGRHPRAAHLEQIETLQRRLCSIVAKPKN